jgi:hypothetical protein
VGVLSDGSIDAAYVDCYLRNGGEGSVGIPTNYVHRWSDSVAGWSQDYQGGSANHGAITRADSSGTAYFIHGTIWDKWITTDTGNPNGFLGWPVTDEQDGLASWVTGIVCRYTKFEHGTINYHPTGAYHGQAFEVHGAIYTKYQSMSYAASPLGLPTSDEFDATPSPHGGYGRLNRFEGGSLYYNAARNEAHPVYGSIGAQYEAANGTGGDYGFPTSDPYAWGDTTRQDFEGGYLVASGAIITGLTFVPGTLASGTDVTARLDATGAASAALRIDGLRCDQPPITMSWDGSAWVATISGSLAAWARGDALQVTALAYDSTGAAAVAVQQLAVDTGSPPSTDPGDPNAIWIDESAGCGIFTGSADVLDLGPPFSARLSMTTVVSSLFGEDGPMTLWPAVTSSSTGGVSLCPSSEGDLGTFLACYDRCSPEGGPAYDATFASVDDTAVFSASIDSTAVVLTILDCVLKAASEAVWAETGVSVDISPSEVLENLADFINLAPVREALAHFEPWPSASGLPLAAAAAAGDLSHLITDPEQRDQLRELLEEEFQEALQDLDFTLVGKPWEVTVSGVFTAWDLLKILRDEIVWGTQTAGGDPALVYHVYRTSSGSLGVRASGSLTALSSLVRLSGLDVTYDAAEATGGTSYSFAVTNTGDSGLWEFRIDLPASALPPISVAAPAGWQADTVWSGISHYARWYTQGPGGWGAGDFGPGVVAPSSTLSGFRMLLAQPLEQCAFSAMDTNLRLDAGMLSMVPGVVAAPPDFAPGADESTALVAYTDRAGTTAVTIYRDGEPYVEVDAPQDRPAGEFIVPWDGRDADGIVAAAGDYEARMTVAHPDGSTDTKSALLLLTFSDVPHDFWAHDQVYSLLHSRIVGGYPGGAYQPGLPVTRDQMAVYVSRALAGGDSAVATGPSSASFPDVPTDHWAFRYIEYAKANNIVQGYPDGYHPAEAVTRDQMATYIARAIVEPTGDDGLSGYTGPDTPSFADVPTDQWAYRYIEYCHEHGIVQGYWNGYHPGAVVTRDQMAVYVARAFGLVRSVGVRARVQGPPEGGLATDMQLEVSASGDPGTAVYSGVVALDSSGRGSLSVSLPYGTYDVWGKAPTHLARRLRGWALAADGVALLDFGTLLAGDLVDDNVIDQADADYLAARFLTDDPTADINGDGIVNSTDFSILNGNWGQVGDE